MTSDRALVLLSRLCQIGLVLTLFLASIILSRGTEENGYHLVSLVFCGVGVATQVIASGLVYVGADVWDMWPLAAYVATEFSRCVMVVAMFRAREATSGVMCVVALQPLLALRFGAPTYAVAGAGVVSLTIFVADSAIPESSDRMEKGFPQWLGALAACVAVVTACFARKTTDGGRAVAQPLSPHTPMEYADVESPFSAIVGGDNDVFSNSGDLPPPSIQLGMVERQQLGLVDNSPPFAMFHPTMTPPSEGRNSITELKPILKTSVLDSSDEKKTSSGDFQCISGLSTLQSGSKGRLRPTLTIEIKEDKPDKKESSFGVFKKEEEEAVFCPSPNDSQIGGQNPRQRGQSRLLERFTSNAGMERRNTTFNMQRTVNWKKGMLLGGGAFGTVHIGLNQDTGELMAVKNITFDPLDPNLQDKLVMLQNEITILEKLDHENIVKYYFAGRVESGVNIFLEYVPGGSIHNVLQSFGALNEMVVVQYTHQILLGLAYLHKNNVLHGDIKGANLLLAVDGHIKLADFGSATLATKRIEKSKMTGTPVWMAPEVVRGEIGCGWASDIWSLGCTVMEMLTGKIPWAHLGTPIQILHYLGDDRRKIVLPDGLSNGSVSFFHDCFQRDPAARPTAEQLLDHHFFFDPCVNSFSTIQGMESFPEQPSSFETRSPRNSSPDVLDVTQRPNDSHRNSEDLIPLIVPPMSPGFDPDRRKSSLSASVLSNKKYTTSQPSSPLVVIHSKHETFIPGRKDRRASFAESAFAAGLAFSKTGMNPVPATSLARHQMSSNEVNQFALMSPTMRAQPAPRWGAFSPVNNNASQTMTPFKLPSPLRPLETSFEREQRKEGEATSFDCDSESPDAVSPQKKPPGSEISSFNIEDFLHKNAHDIAAVAFENSVIVHTKVVTAIPNPPSPVSMVDHITNVDGSEEST